MRPERTLAVALHDIEPATFERAALLRDWLDDLGVGRVTLLVIPARDLHPLSDRRPEVAAWLLDRASRGDAIAQHGFRHLQSPPARWPPHPRSAMARESPEFVGLDPLQTVRALDAGRRILKLAGIEPRASSLRPTPTRPSCASRCVRGSSGGPAPGGCIRHAPARHNTSRRRRSGLPRAGRYDGRFRPHCCASQVGLRAARCESTCIRSTSHRRAICSPSSM
jgi:hypothetical protein